MIREFKFKLPRGTREAYFNLITIGNRCVTFPMTFKNQYWSYFLNNEENYIEYNIHYITEDNKVHFQRDITLFENDELKLIEEDNVFNVLTFSENQNHLSRCKYNGKDYLFFKCYTVYNYIKDIIITFDSGETKKLKILDFFQFNHMDFVEIPSSSKTFSTKFILKNNNEIYFDPKSGQVKTNVVEIDLKNIFDCGDVKEFRDLGAMVSWFSDEFDRSKFEAFYFSSLFKSKSVHGYDWTSLNQYYFKKDKIKDMNKFLPEGNVIIDLPLNHCHKSAKVFKKFKEIDSGTTYRATANLPELNLDSNIYFNYVKKAISNLISKKRDLAFRVDSAMKMSDEFLLKLKNEFPNNKFYYESWNTPRYNLSLSYGEFDNKLTVFFRDFLIQHQDLAFKLLAASLNYFFNNKSLHGNNESIYSLSNQDFESFEKVANPEKFDFFYLLLCFLGGRIFLDVRDFHAKTEIYSHMNKCLDFLKEKSVGPYVPAFEASENGFRVHMNGPENKVSVIIDRHEHVGLKLITDTKYFKVYADE